MISHQEGRPTTRIQRCFLEIAAEHAGVCGWRISCGASAAGWSQLGVPHFRGRSDSEAHFSQVEACQPRRWLRSASSGRTPVPCLGDRLAVRCHRDGRRLKSLNVILWLAILVGRCFKAKDVLTSLEELISFYPAPAFIRSHTGLNSSLTPCGAGVRAAAP